MTNHEWGVLIALYLFLGGLSAGLLVLSSVASLYGAGRADRIAAAGAFAAPWPVLAGTVLLVVDLGQPFYFWKLLVAFQPRSPMWIGTWLLTLFAAVSLPYAFLLLPAPFRIWTPRDVRRWRTRFAAVGCVIGAGVGIYTGILLGVLVARPLWNTPLLAQVFLISALSSGAALLLAMLRRGGTAQETRLLTQGDAALIVVELVVLGWMMLDAFTSTATSSAGLATLIGGVYGWIFWIGVVFLGLLVPLALEAAEISGRAHAAPAWFARLTRWSPLFVLAGGFTLRLVIVEAGQATGLF